MNSRWIGFVAPVAVGAALLLAWQAWVAWYDIPAYIVPSPLNVFGTLVRDCPLGTIGHVRLLTLEFFLGHDLTLRR